MTPLLEVAHLTTGFSTAAGTAVAVNDVSFTVRAGETLAIVGESGSGKSVTALSIMGLVPPPGRVLGGSVRFQDRDLLTLTESEMQTLRGAKLSLIFQEPMTALNPVFSIGDQIAETLVVHGDCDWPAARRPRRGVARGGQVSGGGPARARLSAPAVRRPASARRDRDGPRVPAGARHRRRADDGARRHDSGRDPRPPEGDDDRLRRGDCC